MRAVAERLLGHAGRSLLRTGLPAQRTLILAYHNIVPDDLPRGGDRSLHLRVSSFARQLDLLETYCEVIPLATVLTPAPRERLAVAITFDDAYRGALTVGARELASRGLPATIFVPTGMLGDRAFWWDEYADPETDLPAKFRARALGELRGSGAAIHAAYPEIVAAPPALRRSVTEAELAEAVAGAPFTLGAHTASHPNLAALTPAELEDELRRPLAWLLEHFPAATIPWIAYPYGVSSPAVEAAAADAGYAGGLMVEGGAFRAGRVRPWAVPRLNIPSGVSLDGFALRLAGLKP